MPDISWQKDGSDLIANQRIVINANGTVDIVGVISLDAGTYTCTAQNAVGSASASTTLGVIGRNLLDMLVFLLDMLVMQCMHELHYLNIQLLCS